MWALHWVGRLTAAEMRARQAKDQRLGELLLGVITSWDVDQPEAIANWQRDVDELRYWSLPFWRVAPCRRP